MPTYVRPLLGEASQLRGHRSRVLLTVARLRVPLTLQHLRVLLALGWQHQRRKWVSRDDQTEPVVQSRASVEGVKCGPRRQRRTPSAVPPPLLLVKRDLANRRATTR